ncbi:lysine--tRNA ligase [Nisaea acidiphila]|uniref:Lysine--tRNA ligase n=1 Tax=Nisaea acidiphila TaxID=1862145 RepID=A0A9J7AW39_9PROT|nr:lysine--tRNA ligase [Nisaea acidiphila]UUX51334.1 lysine--tRNA ligase [Nisaea acidiphila]
MTSLIPVEIAENARAWPFEEARKIVARLGGEKPEKGHVILETGYGPSGLPHIGTFGEVFRTTMVRRAFEQLVPDVPTKLIAFSDDMDGFRKVPTNLPNQEMLAQYLNKPLTQVPDPFGTHESFGAHNNARLQSFLDSFGFEYEFMSSTECYKSGMFDKALLETLQRYEEIMAIMLPTLGAERQATYSPFLPVCPTSGNVLQVLIVERNTDAGTVVYEDPESGTKVEVPVTGGHCKLQWKCDWAMRWHALGVDYEMSGKDLIDSVKQSSKICRTLGSRPPEGFNYELFLDENGEKISKSKGNGLSVEEWLRYGSPESLSLFMFQQPKRAKRLYFDVIPKNTDEYFQFLDKLAEESDDAKRVENPAWHITQGKGRGNAERVPLSFGLLLNLASVCHAEDKSVLWGFIERYAPGATPESHPTLDKLAGYAVNYYQDFARPAKQYRAPSDLERAAFQDLVSELKALPADADAETIQTQVYEVGKRHEFENLRDWFKGLYQVLLGQDQGPRFGSFIALYGRDETVALIEKALAGEDLAA